MDHDGPWGFDAADGETLCAIFRRLAHFESMTVNEVFHHGGEPGKDYDVESMPNQMAVTRLQEAGFGDQTKIWRLAFGGKPRLYGFLNGNIFYVFWWDPEHQVWPSSKKHT